MLISTANMWPLPSFLRLPCCYYEASFGPSSTGSCRLLRVRVIQSPFVVCCYCCWRLRGFLFSFIPFLFFLFSPPTSAYPTHLSLLTHCRDTLTGPQTVPLSLSFSVLPTPQPTLQDLQKPGHRLSANQRNSATMSGVRQVPPSWPLATFCVRSLLGTVGRLTIGHGLSVSALG